MLTQAQKSENKLRALTMMNVAMQLSPETREYLANNVADELDRKQAEIDRLSKFLRQKDEAMGILFDRLAKAGIDCSDLFS